MHHVTRNCNGQHMGTDFQVIDGNHKGENGSELILKYFKYEYNTEARRYGVTAKLAKLFISELLARRESGSLARLS